MAAEDFVHLHLHSDYSLLDGAIQHEALAEQAQRLGFKAIAVTDHGNMFGAMGFADAMKKVGIKPISAWKPMLPVARAMIVANLTPTENVAPTTSFCWPWTKQVTKTSSVWLHLATPRGITTNPALTKSYWPGMPKG
jgi:DNA polymerase III, alpha subunit (EC 2.7.7.7)